MPLFVSKIQSLLQNKTVRNGGIFAVFSFVNQGINFILLFVLSWYISTESYGKLNLFYTGVAVVSILISLDTQGIIAVNYFKKTRKQLAEYVNAILLITLIVSITLGICVSAFNGAIFRISSIELNYQLICVFICASSILYNLLTEIYRLEERPFIYGWLTITSTLLNLGGTLLFVVGLKYDWQGRVFANLLMSTCFIVISLYILTKKKYILKLTPSKDVLKEVLTFGVPLIPHHLTGWIRQGLDRFIINSNYSMALVGQFSFAINFANIISILGTAFNQSNSVYIYQSLSNDSVEVRRKLRKQTVMMLFLFLCLTGFTIALCYILIPIALPAYKGSLKFVVPLCCSGYFQCVYLLFCNYLFFFKKTRQLMYITFGTSLFHLGLSLCLTRYSVMWPAYISLISSLIQAVAVYFYSMKQYKLF